MRHVAHSAVAGAFVVAALLAFGAEASPQANKCLAGKNKCASNKMKALLKCHSRAEKDGVAVDLACTQKATSKFDGGTNPAKGCFAKLEAQNDGPCRTTGDTSAIEDWVDEFVLDVVDDLDPTYPTPVQNDCSAGKKKCVYKKAAALLKCNEKAVKDGVPFDPACAQKAKDKFDGGTNPARGCFEKLEANSSCLTNDDTAALELEVDGFVANLLCQLGYDTMVLPGMFAFCDPTPSPTPAPTSTGVTPTPTPTPTPIPSPSCTCGPGCPGCPGPTVTPTPTSTPQVLKGALTATTGRFNYNLTLGLPGANSACNSNFAGTHACTYSELQSAEAAGDLVGLKDTSMATVTSFWAIEPLAADLMQCVDDNLGGSNLRWEYGTAHTASRGQKVALNNPAGTLGPLQTGLQCNFSGSSNVGCCQ